jgi:ribosomal protein S15P/S13E
MHDEIKDELIKIMGTDAFNNGSTSKDVEILVKCIKYMNTQLKIVQKNYCDEEGKEYINTVLKNSKEILQNFGKES